LIDTGAPGNPQGHPAFQKLGKAGCRQNPKTLDHLSVSTPAGVHHQGLFQRILLDAPCSDLGTLRRHPELKWRRKERDIALFSEKQRHLFASLVDHLGPGGVMVYSVCSPEPEEGEALVEEALTRFPQLEPVDFGHLLPEAIQPYYKKEGFLTLYPHYANTDGFFMAKVRRKD